MNTRRLGRSSATLPVACILMSAAACGDGREAMLEKAPASIEVRVARAAVQPLVQTFDAGGIVKARTTAQISSRIVAELREMRVQPGDRVRQGQILAVLDDRDLDARRSEAQASLAAAESAIASADAERESAGARLALAREHHRRIQQLREQKSATPEEQDRASAELRVGEAAMRAADARASEASASVTAARSAIRAAEVAVSFSTIVAPFDGLITNKLLEPGNMAAPGTPILSIETTDGFRVEVQVDAGRARLVRVGDTVSVAFGGYGEADTMSGRVVEVARSIDPVSHASLVKVELPVNAAARSGAFARARFTGEHRQALAVPSSAIQRRGQLSLVYVVDGTSRARMRAVTAGEASGDVVEVLAGMQPGETVIVNPPGSVVDGSEVRVAGGRP
jgi:multidrug efflux pump subunit AcrA (membrane-fusion protein)